MAKLVECVEHGHEVRRNDKVYVAKFGRKIVAFCEPIVRRIPDSDRSPHRGPDMVDIHLASANPDHYVTDKLSLPSLRAGKLLFSVPLDSFKKYFPRSSEQLFRS